MRLRTMFAAASVGLAGLAGLPDAIATPADSEPTFLTGEHIARPVVTEPPPGMRGHALWDSFYDLSAYGYEEAEYFVSGTAADIDGNQAAYTTRVLVFRPVDDADFNGTVLLDWVNVTAQFENAVDSIEAHEHLLRDGFAWVHVSAQAAGLDSPFPNPLVPKKWDPERYADIAHPGDQYAYDMFSQIAKAMKHGGDAGSLDPMADLSVEVVLAAGQSQSASKLTDYVVDWQEDAQIIDGFLIHGTFGHDGPATSPVPVIHLESDADVSTTAQPSDNVVLWEVAGAAHSDFWIGYHSVAGNGPRSQASAPKLSRADKEALSLRAGNYGEQLDPLLATCTVAGATMPMHYTTSAAIEHLDNWVRGADRPADGPKISVPTPPEPMATMADEAGLLGGMFMPTEKDDFQNTVGGIRLAPIEHPVATYVADACQLGGTTVPFTEAQLLAMYGSHQAYFEDFRATVVQNVLDGWILPDDADDLNARACDARNRFGIPQHVAVPYCHGHAPTYATTP